MIVVRTKMDKMPDSCVECSYGERYGCVGDVKCIILSDYFTNNTEPPYKERPDECPLIELDNDLVSHAKELLEERKRELQKMLDKTSEQIKGLEVE